MKQLFDRTPMDGAITMLFGDDGMRLEVLDKTSQQTFLYVQVPADQISKMLSRLCSIPCRFGLHAVERVGLQQEYKTFAFPMPAATYTNQKEVAIETVRKLCPEGWVADEYFDRQNSFYRDGTVEMARTMIRRYVQPSTADATSPRD